MLLEKTIDLIEVEMEKKIVLKTLYVVESWVQFVLPHSEKRLKRKVFSDKIKKFLINYPLARILLPPETNYVMIGTQTPATWCCQIFSTP